MRIATVVLTSLLVSQVAAQQPQRRCGEARNPKNLPAVSTLIDSLGALRELAAAGVSAPELLFSLLYTDTDSFPRTSVLVAPTEEAAVVISRSLRPVHPHGMWAVRLQVTGGDAPAITIARSTYCPPMPEPTTRQVQRFSVMAQPGDRVPPSGNVRVTTHIEISETGAVTEVRLMERSGLRELDDQIVAEWQQRRFYPATIDGVPIPSWYRGNGNTLKL